MTSVIVCTRPWSCGRLKVGSRYVWLEFHEYCGPNFYSDIAKTTLYEPKDENDPVWPEFDKWLDKYKAAKAKQDAAKKRLRVEAKWPDGRR